MGRSVGEIITTVDRLVKEQVQFIAIKEGIRLIGQQNLQGRVTVTLFGLFAEIERELISLRTKEGLAAARATGKRLGRPKGKLGRSKLSGKEDEIQRLLTLNVSKSSIARITGVDRSTLHHFIQSRNLMPKEQASRIQNRRFFSNAPAGLWMSGYFYQPEENLQEARHLLLEISD